MRFLHIKSPILLLTLTAYFGLWVLIIIDEMAETRIFKPVLDRYQDAIMIGLLTLPLLSIWVCLSNIASNRIIAKISVEQTFD